MHPATPAEIDPWARQALRRLLAPLPSDPEALARELDRLYASARRLDHLHSLPRETQIAALHMLVGRARRLEQEEAPRLGLHMGGALTPVLQRAKDFAEARGLGPMPGPAPAPGWSLVVEALRQRLAPLAA